jgi:hypothetical protein
VKIALILAVALVACGGGDNERGASPSSAANAADAGSDCDCRGIALPDICTMCSNGTNACAHFVCVESQCQIQICP